MADSLNAHIEEYLTYYLSLERAPQFAVLVRGKWGAGKSHVVDRIVNAHFAQGKRKWLYISLYGVRSTDEIDDALFRAAFPEIANRAGKVLGRLGKAALKFVHADEFKLSDILDKFDYELFVFDDLERCDLPVSTVLGYINEFVEHNKRKVIIIAHEKEVERSKKYRKRREKLVGMTLEVLPEFEAAYHHFISEFTDEEYRDFLDSNAETVGRVFVQSETSNLRAVRQALGEFQRLFRRLLPEHRRHRVAMSALLNMVLALALEVRAGRLTAEDMHDRKNLLFASVLKKDEGGGKNKLLQASERYPDVSLDNEMLSDEVMANYFGKGIIDANAIIPLLNASSYFASEAEPAWRTLWHALDRTSDQFDAALAEFKRQYKDREFAIAGEILHALAIRLWLAREGFIPDTLAKVVTSGKKYINDVLTEGRLQPYPLHEYQDEVRHGSYGGLGFHARDSKEFLELDGYLHQKRLLARLQTYQNVAKELMAELVQDPMMFARRICSNESGDSMYSRVPVLAVIDAAQFVETLLTLHPDHQRNVCTGLKARYEFGFRDDLASEETWFSEVKGHLEKQIDSMSAFDRYRVGKLLEWYFDLRS